MSSVQSSSFLASLWEDYNRALTTNPLTTKASVKRIFFFFFSESLISIFFSFSRCSLQLSFLQVQSLFQELQFRVVNSTFVALSLSLEQKKSIISSTLTTPHTDKSCSSLCSYRRSHRSHNSHLARHHGPPLCWQVWSFHHDPQVASRSRLLWPAPHSDLLYRLGRPRGSFRSRDSSFAATEMVCNAKDELESVAACIVCDVQSHPLAIPHAVR